MFVYQILFVALEIYSVLVLIDKILILFRKENFIKNATCYI